MADELLWHHAFVSARTRKGVTPLHLAAKNGHSRLCQLLIESHGAQLDILSLVRALNYISLTFINLEETFIAFEEIIKDLYACIERDSCSVNKL